MPLGPRPGGGGSGQNNTASTSGGETITLAKSGSDLPFKGPSSLSESDVNLNPQATLIEHDLKTSPKKAIRGSVIGGLSVVPLLTVVDGATTFAMGAGELELVNYDVIPPALPELKTIPIPANPSIPITHTGSRVVWLSFGYNFTTSTLTLHQDLASPGIDLADGKTLWANLNYRDGPGTLDVLQKGTEEPYMGFGEVKQMRALFKALGGIRISGLTGSGNALALTVNIDSGVVSRIGGGVHIDLNNTWQIPTPVLTAQTIVSKYANSPTTTTNYSVSNVIDPTVYATGGSIVVVPGSDPWSVWRVTLAAQSHTGGTVTTDTIAFVPEEVFKTQAEAISAAETNSLKWTEGGDTETAAPAFFIVVNRADTDLTAADFIMMPDRRGTGGSNQAGVSGYNEIQDNGTPLPARSILNLLGGWTVADDAGNNRTNATPPAGGGVNTHLFAMQFSTSSTISGAAIEIPAAFWNGQLPTGYTTFELIALVGKTKNYSASVAGDAIIQIYTRAVDQASTRGVGIGTLKTTQTMLTTASAMSTLIDGPMSKDLKSTPIDFTANQGEMAFFDFSTLGGYFFAEPTVVAIFEATL